MKINIHFLFILLSISFTGLISADTAIKAFGSVEVNKISENGFVYTYAMPGAGNYQANGMFYIVKDKALLIDTPGEDGITDSLITWITNTYKVSIEAIVITHWHMADRLGGLNAVHKRGIKSYASTQTINEAKKRNLPVPENAFDKTLTLKIGGKKVICEYPGAGHTIDNSVVWFPEDKVLFGGCLVKDYQAANLGYTADSDLKEWPKTIMKLEKKFNSAKIVIPGHGMWAESKLTFKHNKELLKSK